MSALYEMMRERVYKDLGMDDRVSIPNIGTDATGPVGAGIGVQGGPNPRDIINIAFPPGALVEEAGQIAALAQYMHKRCPPNLYQTFNGVTQYQSVISVISLDFTPAWWVVRLRGGPASAAIAIAQGALPMSEQITVFNGATITAVQLSNDYAVVVNSFGEIRVVLPGTDHVLNIMGDSGSSNTYAYYNVAALGGDYDPSKVY